MLQDGSPAPERTLPLEAPHRKVGKLLDVGEEKLVLLRIAVSIRLDEVPEDPDKIRLEASGNGAQDVQVDLVALESDVALQTRQVFHLLLVYFLQDVDPVNDLPDLEALLLDVVPLVDDLQQI